MESAQRAFGVLLIDREFVQPGEVEVGTIRMTSADTYVLRWLDPNAKWENDSRPFRYRDVTRLEFGSEYEQTLLAVARSRESDGSYLDDVKPASMKNTGVDQAGRDDAGDG